MTDTGLLHSEGQTSQTSSITPPVGSVLEVDSREISDADSGIGSEDRESITQSLNSTVTNFRHEHGRRYHAFSENAYWLPNDEIEIERLDIQHHAWRLSLNGKLHVSPIRNDIANAVDIGTGTGQWAIEFADAHPATKVLGTDLSPIQPPWTPANCEFLIDNAEQDWIFEERFDFVHSRMLLMGIHDWPRFFRQAWDALKPGGWVEMQEVQFPIATVDDGSVPPDAPLLRWSQYVRDAAAKDGIDTMISTQFRAMLEERGFVRIKEVPIKWPVGPWPKGNKEKEVGRWMLENTRQFISAIALALFTKRLGWSTEAVEVFLVDVRKDLEDRRRHYYWQMRIFSAQKPEEAT